MANQVLVVGIGRSGTSALARVLHHLGVFIGHDFVPPSEKNPWGFWEDSAFHALHKAYLSRQLEYDRFIESAYALIERREKDHKVWGFKDPTTCLLLPLYRKVLLPKAWYVSIQRDPCATQWSLFEHYGRVGGVLPGDIFNGWATRQGMLQQWLPPMRTYYTAFETLVSDPASSIQELVQWLTKIDLAPTDTMICEAIASVHSREMNYVMGSTK